MGSGSFTSASYAVYNTSLGRDYNFTSGRVSGQTFEAQHMDDSLNPRMFTVRECLNSEEHPNTIPVILALDVTGSMGPSCKETAETLGIIITNLLKKYQDIEFCIMGIGDLAYDQAPIQMSQFESDVRIAEALDKLYLEKGGGGNGYESYTAAWYMGLHKTKLDCYDKQNRKGIIITMGDEPLNPYLPSYPLQMAIRTGAEGEVETRQLYDLASKKFDIYHIAVDDAANCYTAYKDEIQKTFGELLGPKFKVATIDTLAKQIEDCISESIEGVVNTPAAPQVNENGEISW